MWVGWADVGLWVAVCFLAKISLHWRTCKTTFARLTQSQAISQSFRAFISFRSMRDTTFFSFFETLFIQNYRFLYHGDQKISWCTSMQVAGNQLRNPPVKFRQERWLHIWRSICIQHVQMEAGLTSDPGNDSFSDKIRDAKHVDRSTHYSIFLVFGILLLYSHDSNNLPIREISGRHWAESETSIQRGGGGADGRFGPAKLESNLAK